MPPNPSTALARVVVDELVRNGVGRFVIAPGSRSAALALAAVDQAAAVTVMIDERSAGFFAVGLSRATKTPTAVIVTSGTAVANLYPAVVEADLDGIPLIVLSADRPPELRHAGANQTIDQIAMFGSRVRWFSEMGVAEDRPGSNSYWRACVCHAVASAAGREGGPGPVHVNLAFREPLVPFSDDGRNTADPFRHPVEGRPGRRPWTATRPPTPAVRDDPLASERVLVLAGAGAPPQAVERALSGGWVVAAEPQSGARLPGVITTAHHLASHPAAEALLPEVVIKLGRPGLSRPLQVFAARAERAITVAPPWAWFDADRTSEAIVEQMPAPASVPGAWRDVWADLERIARSALDGFLDTQTGVSEPRTARDVARAVPPGGVLVAGSSMPIRDLDMFMAARPLAVVANRGASGIDGFISTALGVAAGGGRPTVALAGDLSVLHDQNGFLAEPRADMVLVMVNNDGGGIFSFLPQAQVPRDFERVFGTPHGRSFERLAGLHSLAYELIDDPGRLEPAVAEAGPGITLIEVRTERGANVGVHRAATAAVHAALDRA